MPVEAKGAAISFRADYGSGAFAIHRYRDYKPHRTGRLALGYCFGAATGVAGGTAAFAPTGPVSDRTDRSALAVVVRFSPKFI
jgi:hypothetical protein